MNNILQRRASRLILINNQARIFLFRHRRNDGSTFWAPPGGGLEPGETFEQAALREAAEELGLKTVSVKFLWERVTDFLHTDGPVRQTEQFFLLTDAPQLQSAETRRIHDHEGIVEVRWWSTEEIEATNEPVFPEGLASQLRKLAL